MSKLHLQRILVSMLTLQQGPWHTGVVKIFYLAHTGHQSDCTTMLPAEANGSMRRICTGTSLMPDEPRIQTWSTQSIPQTMRLDYWMSTLSTQMWPVTQWSAVAQNFGVELREASLGCLASLSLRISAHDSHRSRHDVSRSQGPGYLLFSNFSSAWGSTHNGYCERLLPGDVVLWADDELDTFIPDGLSGVILRCPVDWMHSWLPAPRALAGRRIAHDSMWGRVLSPMISQMTPDLAAQAPLPHSVLVDQVGAVLALLAGETQTRGVPEMIRRIQDRIRERCEEPELTADDVALSLGVAPRELHRALASHNLTFSQQLLECRITRALEMLEARQFNSATAAEIGRHCGFSSPGHFTRAVRRRTGLHPRQLRHADRRH